MEDTPVKPKRQFNRRKAGRESNPVRVAKIVKEKMMNGEKVVMAEIVRSVGYSKLTSMTPRHVTDTAAYKEEMGDFAERLEKHREQIMQAMEKKDLNQEQYRTLSDAMQKTTHDVQLLRGGRTENVGSETDRITLLAIVKEIRTIGSAPTPLAISPSPDEPPATV